MSLNVYRAPILLWGTLSGIAMTAAGVGCELVAQVDRSTSSESAAGSSGAGGSGGQATSSSQASSSSQGSGGGGGSGGQGSTASSSSGNSGFAYPTDLTAVINGGDVDLTWLN